MGMEITYNRPVPAFMTYSVWLQDSSN
jgi:hypothetical protein